MGDYFRPLRRKIGVVTLLVALVATGGWVRSATLIDHITLPISGLGSLLLISEDGCFICTWSMSPNDEVAGWEIAPLSSRQIVSLGQPAGGFSPAFREVEPDREHLVADGAVPAVDEFKIQRSIIPYWLTNIFFGASRGSMRGDEHRFIRYCPLVISLTLLSTFLLLSKRRQSIPTKTAEPVPNEGP